MLFIANKRHGSMDDLVDTIGEKFFNQFCRMGFVKNGVTKTTSEIKPTWQWPSLVQSSKLSTVRQTIRSVVMVIAFILFFVYSI